MSKYMFLTMLLFVTSINGQFIENYGLKIGIAKTDVKINAADNWNSDLNLESSLKWSIRLWGLHYNLNNWSFVSELGYLEKGARIKMTGIEYDSGAEWTSFGEFTFRYLTYSFLSRFELDLGYFTTYFLAAPQLNFLVGASRGEAKELENSLRGVNLGLSIGAGLPFEIESFDLFLEYRFEHDLYSISKSNDFDLWNYSHSLLLGFEF